MKLELPLLPGAFCGLHCNAATGLKRDAWVWNRARLGSDCVFFYEPIIIAPLYDLIVIYVLAAMGLAVLLM